MSTTKKIAMIGECMIELNGRPFTDVRQTFGGDTLNTAVYAARLAGSDITVSYVTGLGTDIISQQMQAFWRAEGIDTQLICQFPDKSPGLYWIILDDAGERSFMYWRDQAAAKAWLRHEQTPSILTAIAQYQWIYLSGISLAILNEIDRDQLFAFLREYKQNGGHIAFDSNYRKALWLDQQTMREAYQHILSMTDLALLTNEDEMAIWQIEAEQILPNLTQFQIPTLVLKQGEEGAVIIENNDLDTRRTIPSLKVAHVVDTTAAGDSFNAGVLMGLMQNKTIDQACALGHQVASTVIQYPGAIIPQDKMPT